MSEFSFIIFNQLVKCQAINNSVNTMNTESNQSPEFEGQCAFALSTGKKEVEGKENCYLVQGGKKYLFSNPVAKFLWRILPGRKEKAESTWIG